MKSKSAAIRDARRCCRLPCATTSLAICKSVTWPMESKKSGALRGSGRFSRNPKAVPFPFAIFRNRTPKDVGKKLKTSHWSPGIDVAQARGADSELIKKATSWRMEDVVHSTSVVEI